MGPRALLPRLSFIVRLFSLWLASKLMLAKLNTHTPPTDNLVEGSYISFLTSMRSTRAFKVSYQ